MVSVSIYTYPSPVPGTGKRDLEVEAPPGTTIRDLLQRAAVEIPDYYVIMVNGYGADLETQVEDGDRLVLFPAISGG